MNALCFAQVLRLYPRNQACIIIEKSTRMREKERETKREERKKREETEREREDMGFKYTNELIFCG